MLECSISQHKEIGIRDYKIISRCYRYISLVKYEFSYKYFSHINLCFHRWFIVYQIPEFFVYFQCTNHFPIHQKRLDLVIQGKVPVCREVCKVREEQIVRPKSFVHLYVLIILAL